MLFTWFLTGCVVVIILSTPNLLTTTFNFQRADAFQMQSMAILMQMLGCILAGLLADRFGAGRVICLGSLSVAITAVLFYYSLGHAAHSTIFGLYMLLGLFSGTVGVVSYSLVKMFPAPIRFSGISFSYNIAYAIAGGLTLPLVQWLSLYRDIGAVYYIVVLCLITLMTSVVYRKKFETV
jgi:MFS family permease